MAKFQIQDQVGEVVRRYPSLSRVFEQTGIDYCCGGKVSLDEACRKKGIDPQSLLVALEESATDTEDEAIVDAAAMTLTELADHIEQTHHTYLRSEIPRLSEMAKRVAAVHGDTEPRLHEVRRTFLAMAGELSSHMMKEERMLFPMVRQLEASENAPTFHCGTLANPVRQMELEHSQAGSGLEDLRDLTEGYAPPNWACNTYRAMLDGMAHLERDLHQHIHKENNVLFPRALEMEAQKQEQPSNA